MPVEWLNRTKSADWRRPYDQYYSTNDHKILHSDGPGLFSCISTIADLGNAKDQEKAELTKKAVCAYFDVDLEAALNFAAKAGSLVSPWSCHASPWSGRTMTE